MTRNWGQTPWHHFLVILFTLRTRDPDNDFSVTLMQRWDWEVQRGAKTRPHLATPVARRPRHPDETAPPALLPFGLVLHLWLWLGLGPEGGGRTETGSESECMAFPRERRSPSNSDGLIERRRVVGANSLEWIIAKDSGICPKVSMPSLEWMLFLFEPQRMEV